MRKIKISARKSPLSLVQVQEVLDELNKSRPGIVFDLAAIKTLGDKDLNSSLRDKDKSDFFTRELDEMLLEGKCRACIHSAKDLPDPLPQGLHIAAITKGVDSSDSLVLRQGIGLSDLPEGSIIATSSERRQEAVSALREGLAFVDIRGAIEKRLKKIDDGLVDGVVVAEAALIRLNLTHLNRVKLPGKTAPLQGKLAVLVRDDDLEMKELFNPIDSRCAHSIQG